MPHVNHFNSKRPGYIILVMIFACIYSFSCKPKQVQVTGPPNIIIIFTDDQGYQDLGCYGSPDIKTPNIDKIANEGLLLTDFYVTQPVCSASRAGLLTGCYPNRIGIHGALGPGNNVGIASSETTLAEMLKEQGYRTGIFGKWHLGHLPAFNPTMHGFDEYYGIPYSNDMWPYHPWQGTVFNFPDLPLFHNENIIDTLTDQSDLTKKITQRAIRFIEENRSEPFFLYVPHPQPHVPLFASKDFDGQSGNGIYSDVISEIDWSTGEIIKTLEDLDLSDNTLIIYTSDNGPWLSYGQHSGSADPLKEGKGTAWEGGVRVPCVMKLPGRFKANRTISAPLMTIDLLPTIAELVGASLPDQTIDGKSALSLLSGKSTHTPQEAYYYYYHTNELHAIRSGDWKMYFPHSYRTLNGRKGTNDGIPIDYEYITLEEKELYNLVIDKEESQNVIASNPLIVKKLDSLATRMRMELGDSLLDLEGTGNREVGKVEDDLSDN